MYVGSDFPPISPNDARRITFDFVDDIAATETIVSAQWFLEVPQELNGAATDSGSQSKVSGTATINGTQVTQLVGPNLVAGIIYRHRCVAISSASADLELYSHQRCNAVV